MAQILMYEDKPFSYIASGKGINYDNTISGLTATNIQDAIDEIAQGGSGSGGHTIIDDSGTSLAQKSNLKFGGVYSHNTTNDSVVDIVREFQSKSAIEALTGEEAKGFQYLDDNQYDAFTASEIGFDNTDTSFTGTDIQEVLEEIDGKSIKAFSLLRPQIVSNSPSVLNTYENRKFSDYDFLCFSIGTIDTTTNLFSVRENYTIVANNWVQGYRKLLMNAIHGSTSSSISSYSVGGMYLSYQSDTSISVELSGSLLIDAIEIVGYKIL